MSSKPFALPESIHLHNLFPLDTNSCSSLPQRDDDIEGSNHNKKWFRPDHSTNLLHQAQLRIVVGDDDRRTIYTSPLTPGRPVIEWKHINETAESLSFDEYETVAICISLHPLDGSGEKNQQRPLLEFCIHPSRLTKIPQVPDNLPLNTVILYYEDGSMRVSLPLYQVLMENRLIRFPQSPPRASAEEVAFSALSPSKQQQIQPTVAAIPLSPPMALKPKKKTGGDDSFSMFGDDVFKTLDQVTPSKIHANQSLLELDDESLATPVLTPSAPATTGPDQLSENKARAAAGFESRISHDELLSEKKQLELLLLQEQEALEEELAKLQGQKEPLLRMMQMVKVRNKQTEQVVQETRLLQTNTQKAAFVLETQRIRLFRELQTIYPVTLVGERYRIGGLEIPGSDGQSVAMASLVSDEELAASMGYLCHAVSMMSKYLSVQLRYRLYCHSSRSAIQSEQGIIFPLFPGRERDLFEYGVKLLVRNVECLCLERGITSNSAQQQHVLAKVKRLYEVVIDGY